MANLNVLSDRYATPAMNDIFSKRQRVVSEREFWVAVMDAQRILGLNIPREDVEKYRNAINDIDLDLIDKIERVTKHDVKARIEAFVKAANAQEHVHKGMTARDLSDNVDQIEIRTASRIIFGKYVSVLRHLLDRAQDYVNIMITARTHHQAAQPTLLGRRMTMWAEELHYHLVNFERFIENYPMRDIKGPVGTQADMLSLLGSKEKVAKLEEMIAAGFGFSRILGSPGQVYFRSLDSELLSHLSLLSDACSNYAIGMRLMSGEGLVTEGFKEGQVGSSAMPHKMNTRSSERINGLSKLVKMYSDGASRVSGDQWEEGDVSCSSPRRVIIPDSFYASDGLCETTLTVLNDMGVYPYMITKEVETFLPFLASTQILMEAVKAGIGREKAHKIIKKHSVAEALRMRQEGATPDVLSRLAGDPDFKAAGISVLKLNLLIKEKDTFVGNAYDQIMSVKAKAQPLLEKYSAEAKYEPLEIL